MRCALPRDILVLNLILHSHFSFWCPHQTYLMWGLQTFVGPLSQVQSGLCQSETLSNHCCQSLWFTFHPYNAALSAEDFQPWKPGFRVSPCMGSLLSWVLMFWDITCSACKFYISPVTTSIMHKRAWWHEIACTHLSWWALIASASSPQGRLQPNQYLWSSQPKANFLQLLLKGVKAA